MQRKLTTEELQGRLDDMIGRFNRGPKWMQQKPGELFSCTNQNDQRLEMLGAYKAEQARLWFARLQNVIGYAEEALRVRAEECAE